MIKIYDPSLEKPCRDFLAANADANYCHDPAWAAVIRESYRQDAFTLVSVDERGAVDGIAPACFMASALFGRKLVCLPYLDYGGPLGGPDAAARFREDLSRRASERKAALELRSLSPLPGLPEGDNVKVAMILPVEGSGDAYWKKLDAKVRNQVRKAEKSEVKVEWGGAERLDDFFGVFTVNMRDLGSPTHSRGFFAAVLKHFPGAQVGVAYRQGRPIGGLFRILWKRTLVIPWASTLKEERQYCPNNALYWESIRFAFEQACAAVDFGRSTREEGTYKFKKQWLAEERPLHWYQFDAAGKVIEKVEHLATSKLGWTREIWARLPLFLANSLGPQLRKHISA